MIKMKRRLYRIKFKLNAAVLYLPSRLTVSNMGMLQALRKSMPEMIQKEGWFFNGSG
jgi:hypothetical protein